MKSMTSDLKLFVFSKCHCHIYIWLICVGQCDHFKISFLEIHIQKPKLGAKNHNQLPRKCFQNRHFPDLGQISLFFIVMSVSPNQLVRFIWNFNTQNILFTCSHNKKQIEKILVTKKVISKRNRSGFAETSCMCMCAR